MTQSKPVNAMRAARPVRYLYSSQYPLAETPAGVVSPSCREHNLVSSKRGALVVLKSILDRPIDEHLLIGEDNSEIHETIVAAEPVRATEGVQVEQAD